MDTLIVEYQRENKVIEYIIGILKTLKGVKIRIKEDETLMSKEEFFAMVDNVLADYESGKDNFTRVTNKKELSHFLNSL